MRNLFDILRNDRALVEISRHEMRCGSDHLHAACICLMIRSSTLEPRKKAMVNVDAASGEVLSEIVRQ